MSGSDRCFRLTGLILILWLGHAMIALGARPSAQRLLDRVAARVNNEIITENELLLAAFGDIRQADTVMPGTTPNVRETLNTLIDDRLMAQAAREEIKEVPEETITNRVEGIVKERRSLFGSDAAFTAALTERGWDLPSYKKYLHDIEQRVYVVQAALARRVRITDEDVSAFTLELQKKGESATQYRLRQILIALPPQSSAAEADKAQKRMLTILEQIRQGVPFDQLAREQSDDKQAKVTGGDLGWIDEKSLQRPILEAVASLERGQTSQPVRTDKGLHLFQLIRKRTPREMLFEKRMEEVRKRWTTELRRRAQIKILLPELGSQ